MTSSSASENFIFSVPAVKYVVACIGVNDEIICLDDVDLTQDFKVLAELQNPIKRGPEVQEFVDDTVANFDENLLTNANFKSLLNDENSLTHDHSKTISTDSGNATESSHNHSKTITTDSGDVTESSRKPGKCKHPQFEGTIAKRTRSKFSRSTPRSSCSLQDCRASLSYSEKSSPVLKRYQKRKTHWKSKRENVQAKNTPRLEKNRQNLQLNTSTESKVNQKESTELSTNINSPLNKTIQNCKQSESIKTVLDSEKETCGSTEFKTNINLPLNKTVSTEISNLSETAPDNDKESVEFSRAVNSLFNKTVEKRTNETIEFSTNSTWNKTIQNSKQSESIKTVLDSEKETHGSTEFKTNINLPLNKTVSKEISNLSETAPDNDKESVEFSRAVNSLFNKTVEKRTNETNEFSTNSTCNKTIQNYEQSEETSDLKKTIPDSLEGTESKSEATLIDIIYELDEFETMVNDFRAVMIRELSSKSSQSQSDGKKVEAKSEDGNAGREEELLIFCMEDEYKRQFGETEDSMHGEDELKFPKKMPKWKTKLNKYKCNNP